MHAGSGIDALSRLLRRLALCAAIGGMVAAPAAASAEKRQEQARPKKISKRDRARAQKLFSQGYQKFVDLDYKGALVLFQESFDLSGNAGLLLYIGLCYQKLGDYPRAIRQLEDFLELVPRAPQSERSRARGEIEEMQRRLEQEEQARESEERAAEERLENDLTRGQETGDETPLWKSWKLWTGVGVVAVAAGATATFFILRDDGIPDSDLGNIPLGIRF